MQKIIRRERLMASPSAQETAREPVPTGLNHLSVPVKDVRQSTRFFMEVLGAEFIFELQDQSFAEVRCGGMVIGLSKQESGWTGPEAEFPHYGFQIDAD